MAYAKAELTEEQQMRMTSYQCISCGHGILVGSQYPIGMPIPRTLELFCSSCKVTNILYRPAFWAKPPDAPEQQEGQLI